MKQNESVMNIEYEGSQPNDQYPDKASRQTEKYLEHTIGLQFTDGNKIEVLRNGVEIFPAMLEAIDRAKNSVLFETYVYWTGDIADRFSELLAKKSTEGLRVRVLLDSHGASPMKDTYLERMKNAGVKVAWFRPLRWRIWDYDKRTHRKVLVCDNRVAFTGGVGIAEEWEGDARNNKEWRETHFRIEGPAVAGLSGAFWNNWIDIEGEQLPLERHFKGAYYDNPGKTRAMVARSSPATHQSEMELVFEALLSVAKKSVTVTTPYFNIRRKTINLIKNRAKEGIVFNFLLPDNHIDKKIELPVADECIEPLVNEPGVRFFRFQPSMIHTKVIRVDETLSCIGSPNFNQRSRKKDFEIALIVNDEGLAKTLDEHFQQDLKRSERVEPHTIKAPNLLRRITGKFLMLFREQL